MLTLRRPDLLFASAVALLAIAALSSSCTRKESQAPRVVNLATWSQYVSEDLIKSFETQTGIKVQVSNYSSNEELLAKLQAGASGYDVAVPSDYMVFAMAKLGLLEELDHSKLTHLAEIDGKFKGRKFDPTNKYSVPYDWGTTGIAINTEKYKGKVTGWKDVFNQPALKGKFTLLDDARETIGAALKAQGLSLNTKDPADIAKAQALLIKTRSQVSAFTSEPMMALLNGETAVAHVYMSDGLQSRRKTNGKIQYVIPQEGATLWIDNLVIPKGAAHVENALALVNFLLDAHSGANTTQNILVAPVNTRTMALLPSELKADPFLFPSPSVLAKCEMMEDLGDAIKLYDQAWTEIKAARE